MMNTGDDALLAAACWGARKFLNADRIWATAPTVPLIDGAELIRPVYIHSPRFQGENGLRAYARALCVDNVVFGGGSVFHTARDMKSKIKFLKLAGRGPHVAVGVGVGPFASKEDEQACAELLKRLDFVGLRDRESLNVVKAIAPDVRSVKTFDLAPLLLRIADIAGNTRIVRSPRRGIGLALCDYERYVGGDTTREVARREKIRKFLELLVPEIAEELVLIDFNGHPYYGDRRLHEEIANYAAGRFRVRHVPYVADPLSALREIASLRAMVAMRLHAAVFAFLAETPTIILSYHPKCLGWAEDVGMNRDLIFDSVVFDPEQLAYVVHRGVEGDTPAPALSPAEAEGFALQNWTWTHELS